MWQHCQTSSLSCNLHLLACVKSPYGSCKLVLSIRTSFYALTIHPHFCTPCLSSLAHTIFQNFPQVGRICSAHANLGLNTTLPLVLSLLHFIDTDRGSTMCLYALHAQLSQSSFHSTSALHVNCKSFNFQSALSAPIHSCIWSAVEPTACCCSSLPQYRLMQRVISALTWPPPCCNTKFHNKLRLMLPLRVHNNMRASKDRKDI